MATDYCYSGATGANDGTSWTDAFTSYHTTTTGALDNWATTDETYMASDNAESVAAAVTFSATNATIASPQITYSVARVGGAYTPQTTAGFAVTGSNDLSFGMSGAWYGVYFAAGNDIKINVAGHSVRMTDCTIEVGTSSTGLMYFGALGGDCSTETYNSTYKFTGDTIALWEGYSRHVCTTLSGTIPSTGLITFKGDRAHYAEFFAPDFSGITTGTPTIVDVSTASDSTFKIDIISGLMPSGYVLHDSGFTNDNQVIELWSTDTAGALYVIHRATYRGDVKHDTTAYLTAGYADDDGGGTNLSVKLEPTSVCKRQSPLKSIRIPFEHDGTTGSSVTFTFEAVENYTTALTDKQAWSHLYYLGGSASTLLSMDSTEAVLTGTTLTTGTGLGNWTGEPAGSRSVKFVHTVTPQQTGIYFIEIFLAEYEAGKVLHFDPVPTVT